MRLAICLMLACLPLGLLAQEDPEYRAEIGGGVGLMSYHGDLGGGILGNVQPEISFLLKDKSNPRTAWSMTIGYGKLKGSSDNTGTWYPETAEEEISFSNQMVDTSFKFEYNFWPYGTGREYRGAVRLTPYFALGLGFTYCDTPKGGVFAMQVPLGLGVKYKLATRLNLQAEWAIHFTGSDKLENVEDPYGVESSGLFKNTDCYSVLSLSLTYDIWAKCKTCNNDDF